LAVKLQEYENNQDNNGESAPPSGNIHGSSKGFYGSAYEDT